MSEKISELGKLITSAEHIVVIQADNPDGDSLGSALALEEILGNLDKQVYLYCAVDIPGYLKYLQGWDRVSPNMPTKFDLSIIVDTSADSLLEKLNASPERTWVAAKPVAVLDHHGAVECDIPYASLVINEPTNVSTGELIFDISKELKWPISPVAGEYVLQSILSDTLGLTTDAPKGDTYRRIGELIDLGVDRAKLEESRRELSKMHPKVYAYKATLIERTEFYAEGQLALVVIPEDELYDISPLYNPGALITSEMNMVEGVNMSIAIKRYRNRVTGAVRCGGKNPIAHELAKKFGGGGHAYAAGFKVESETLNFEALKAEIIAEATKLLS